MNGTKDFAFAQELSIEDRTKKETHCVLLKQHEYSVSRGFPLGDGCRYTHAAACNDDENAELSRDQKLGALRGLGDLGIGREQSKEAAAKMREAHAAE